MKNFSKVAVIVCLALALVLCAVACQPDTPSKGEVTQPDVPSNGETTQPDNPSAGEVTQPDNPSAGEVTQPDVPSKGVVTIVVAPLEGEATEYTVDLSDIAEGGGVVAILDYLKDNDGLDYACEDGGYGAYLTKVGNLQQNNATGEYIYIYTSVAKDFDVSAYASTVEYKGKTLTSSGVGVSSMSVEDGAIIYFTIIVY